MRARPTKDKIHRPAPARKICDFAEVIPLTNVDKAFTYSIPVEIRSIIRKYQLVEVPFGNQKTYGLVTRLKQKSSLSGRVKPVSRILNKRPLALPHHLELARWISKKYFATIGNTIRAILPKAVLRESSLDRASQNQVLNRFKKIYRRIAPDQSKRDRIELTADQNKALKAILGPKKRFLLYGVTSSGKTEIYLQAIKKMIQGGKQSIVLIPEISLTPQTIAVFESRFPGQVAVLHSRLAKTEKFSQWLRIMSGRAKIVIGPRSAIFAPTRKLGLIILDEEHETSYKQFDLHPLYDAREVALFLSKIHHAKVIFGSATPSVETYYKALTKELELIQLKDRINFAGPNNKAPKKLMPIINVVDMRKERALGNHGIFSNKLIEKIRAILKKNKQVILFLNRRGFSRFIICQDCGYQLRCPQCDITLVYHQAPKDGLFKCHHCGFHQKNPGKCPNCGGPNLRFYSGGTERIEEELKVSFPKARIERLDKDTNKSKSTIYNIYEKMANSRSDILIGTQMVAKGLDLPNVNLVGIVSADGALAFPSYKSSYRTFSLITQVAGRAGRRKDRGEVVLQTLNPHHEAIKAAVSEDHTKYYANEINNRMKFGYPPFKRVIKITYSHKNRAAAEEKTTALAKDLARVNQNQKDIIVLGPVESFLFKLRGKFRYHVIIKIGLDTDPSDIIPALPRPWKIDIDPEDIL